MTFQPLARHEIAGRVLHVPSPQVTSYMVQLSDHDGHIGLGVCPYRGRPDRVLDILTGLFSDGGAVPSLDQTQGIAQYSRSRTDRSVGTALATAWQDLIARQNGQPLGEWLGGTMAPVLTFAELRLGDPLPSPEQAAEAAERAASHGHQELLVSPFDPTANERGPEPGLERLRAVRDAIGPAVGLRVELRAQLTLHEIASVAGHLNDLDVRILHGVTPIADVATLQAVRESTGCQIASVATPLRSERLRRSLDLGLLDEVYLDVGRGAGPTWLLAELRALQAAGTRVGLHGPDGPVNAAIAGHILSTLGNGRIQVVAEPGKWRRAGVTPIERVPGGTWLPQRSPGIGLEVNPRVWKPVEQQRGSVAS